MKLLATTLLVLLSNFTFAQVTFKVNNFSKDYYGKIFIADTSEVFSKGWVAIYDTKSQKQIIKVDAEELALSLHDGKALANIKQLPYGEQSSIMYEDYNFDGIKDFAIEDGQNSCYHGPSFKIYLGTKNGFKFSPEFTALAQNYCGMFQVDYKTKKISVMTKSGCCWHQFSEFIVENNKPKVVKIVEEDQMGYPYNNYSEENWDGKKMVLTSKRTINLDEDGIKTLLSFTVDKNQKRVVLFNINDRTLNYALIDKNDEVEFSYPINTVYQNPDFTLDKKNNTVTFKNKDVVYTIYDNNDSIGITINTGGKTYNWIGNSTTKKGKLTDITTTQLDNVVVN
ncbi:XAC2610-related protein [Flavobacterium sp. PS2]|uniref:XAC2610-related protein n=1 Tax=Flavobacterium sp. PS2 TaxID=3384157 RepID=UPI00390C4B92